MNFKPYYFSAFEPFGYQRKVLDLLYNYDYSDHTPEILLSGSVGSAKSSLLAHWMISHCLRNKGACIGYTRMSMPDLKRTIYKEIIKALSDDPAFIEGYHYKTNRSTAEINFRNGSSIIAYTFGDRDWLKTKSALLSGMVIEEGTEMDDQFYIDDDPGFKAYKSRLRRAGLRENFMIVASNPGEPSSYLYDYFIEGSKKYKSRHVFYSLTEENPYLDPAYIKQLRQDYSFLEAERYLRGKWISIAGKGIYHAFSDKNESQKDYKVDPYEPIYISFDFNIGHNKPLSAIMYQYIGKIFHFFAESIIDGGYTYEAVDDFYNRGLIDNDHHYIIQGDATGRSRDPSSKQTNYDVIEEYLSKRFIKFEMNVPRSNPPIRTRHSIVNAQLCNDVNQIRMCFYRNVPTAIQGMKLTKLKKGSSYIEDDSFRAQHVSTAVGYGVCATLDTINQKRQGTVQL